MRWWALVPSGLIGFGMVLIALAALQGGAGVAVVVIVPVIYGRSLEFVAGVLLLIAGLFTLPLAFESAEGLPRSDLGGPEGEPYARSGGLILVGPIPIFFGSWKGVSGRTRTIAAIVGSIALVAMIVVLVLYFV